MSLFLEGWFCRLGRRDTSRPVAVSGSREEWMRPSSSALACKGRMYDDSSRRARTASRRCHNPLHASNALSGPILSSSWWNASPSSGGFLKGSPANHRRICWLVLGQPVSVHAALDFLPALTLSPMPVMVNEMFLVALILPSATSCRVLGAWKLLEGLSISDVLRFICWSSGGQSGSPYRNCLICMALMMLMQSARGFRGCRSEPSKD
mmetsp:Transcript_16822/g.40372  ORF Transcript_16822/g.40372 Transcript_16822/m.40372 type:complete len:208 (-) Transcript_16822:238-861(-)